MDTLRTELEGSVVEVSGGSYGDRPLIESQYNIRQIERRDLCSECYGSSRHKTPLVVAVVEASNLPSNSLFGKHIRGRI